MMGESALRKMTCLQGLASGKGCHCMFLLCPALSPGLEESLEELTFISTRDAGYNTQHPAKRASQIDNAYWFPCTYGPQMARDIPTLKLLVAIQRGTCVFRAKSGDSSFLPLL